MITIVKKIGTTMIFHGRLKRMLRRFALSHAQKEGKTEGIRSDTIIEKQKVNGKKGKQKPEREIKLIH